MSTTVLKRQFITDEDGRPVAVILPIDQFDLVRDEVEKRFPVTNNAANIALMEKAAQDPLYLADLHDTMSAYAGVDAQWWEPDE